MEKRFESELAKRISTGRGRASPFGVKFLALAISVVAVLSIGAAAVLGVIATKPAYAGPVEYTGALSGTDYLVYNLVDTSDPADEVADEISVVATDVATDDFAVKREMSTKYVVWDSPAPSTKQYLKVMYTVNVRLRDLAFADPVSGLAASIEPVGMNVGSLDIAFGLGTFTEVSQSFMINGCEQWTYDSLNNLVKAGAVTFADGVATVVLPGDLYVIGADNVVTPNSYAEGDYIAISIMLKAPYDATATLELTETAFGVIVRSWPIVDSV